MWSITRAMTRLPKFSPFAGGVVSSGAESASLCRRAEKRLAVALAGCAVAVLASSAPALASGSNLITQYAGTGSTGVPTAGAATSSDLNDPLGVAVDANGNLYIAD